ncbi:MAG: CbtA family protein [Cohaesibacteraceae bacterium]|nr:CbtA family protein [Cohaesibacteraceae bacterium]
MFMRILSSALFAGCAAGILAALLQLYFVQPVLLHAELYEGGELVHSFSQPTTGHHDLASTVEASTPHDHDNTDPVSASAVSANPDTDGFDLARDGLSMAFTILVYCGYSFILVALMAVANGKGITITARQGLVWGVAGFIAVHFAPAFSLPPEVPGTAAAEVAVRQVWWFSTVAATAAALWLIAFGKSHLPWGVAIILLLAPHVIGAPHPDIFTGPVPPEIAAQFASKALGVGLAAWTLLGLFAAWFWQRSGISQRSTQPA